MTCRSLMPALVLAAFAVVSLISPASADANGDPSAASTHAATVENPVDSLHLDTGNSRVKINSAAANVAAGTCGGYRGQG
jgi:hypothetical protein